MDLRRSKNTLRLGVLQNQLLTPRSLAILVIYRGLPAVHRCHRTRRLIKQRTLVHLQIILVGILTCSVLSRPSAHTRASTSASRSVAIVAVVVLVATGELEGVAEERTESRCAGDDDAEIDLYEAVELDVLLELEVRVTFDTDLEIGLHDTHANSDVAETENDDEVNAGSELHV